MYRRRRWGLPLLLFASTFGFVTWGCCTLKCREDTARVVDVPANEQLPDIHISKKARQQIVWRLASGSTITAVRIALAGKPAPFEDCATSEGLCVLTCHDRACVSGPVSAAVVAPAYYEYTFGHASGATSSDPGIRIDP